MDYSGHIVGNNRVFPQPARDNKTSYFTCMGPYTVSSVTRSRWADQDSQRCWAGYSDDSLFTRHCDSLWLRSNACPKVPRFTNSYVETVTENCVWYEVW